MSFGRLSPSRGPAAPDAHNHMLPQGQLSAKRSLGQVEWALREMPHQGEIWLRLAWRAGVAIIRG